VFFQTKWQTVVDRDNFINTITKQKATVKNRDLSLFGRQILAV
jgi:hypothetical protein